MSELDDSELERLIRDYPQPLREELMACIRSLEVALEINGVPYISWREALRRYRTLRSSNPYNPAKAGLLPPIVLQYAKEVDEAFKRIRKTPELKAAIQSMLQAEKSVKAAKARKVQKEKRHASWLPLVREAWNKAVGPSRREPDVISNSEVYGKLKRTWPEPTLPDLKTIGPLINAIRLELKNIQKSSG